MRYFLSVLGFTSLLLFSACQPELDQSQTDKPTNAQEYPQRIITLSPHLTELVYSIGAQDKLVATVEYSDFPEAANDIPRIGNAFQLDWEKVTALRPDLIIAWQGGNPDAMLDKLEEQGFTVLRLENAGLYALPEQVRALSLRLTGKFESDVAKQYHASLDALKNQYANKARLRVFYQISSEPIYTVDGTHVISDMLELCGAENVFENLGKTSAPVTPEAVVGVKPDVILTTTFTYKDVVRQWDGMFVSDNILSVPADEVTRASLRMLQGTENVCEVLDLWRQNNQKKE